ncbi:hypothetical protein EV424DRAFT_1532444 [Suillus variegatus]|nr:hypothetical protein EV424DRAFT_1532444 [Suillus variegatus]
MTQTVPTSPSSSDYDTPIPVPSQFQLTKKRETLLFGTGLSCPIYPVSPPPDEDKSYVSASVCAPSEETFRDRNGINYSTITCRYCNEEGHCQIKCLKYFCRVCNKHEPRHLSANFLDLKGTCIISAKPGTHAFHYQLRQWENERDNEADEYEHQFAQDADLNPELYQNCD